MTEFKIITGPAMPEREMTVTGTSIEVDALGNLKVRKSRGTTGGPVVFCMAPGTWLCAEKVQTEDSE